MRCYQLALGETLHSQLAMPAFSENLCEIAELACVLDVDVPGQGKLQIKLIVTVAETLLLLLFNFVSDANHNPHNGQGIFEKSTWPRLKFRPALIEAFGINLHFSR